MPDIVKERRVYHLVVDYGRKVEEMLEAGHYGGHTRGISSENFPPYRTGKNRIKLELLLFESNPSFDQILDLLEKMGYLPADIWELLTLGEKRPRAQLKGPIISLGSIAADPYSNRYRNLGALSFPYLFSESLDFLSRRGEHEYALEHRSVMLLYHTEIANQLHCWIAAVHK